VVALVRQQHAPAHAVHAADVAGVRAEIGRGIDCRPPTMSISCVASDCSSFVVALRQLLLKANARVNSISTRKIDDQVLPSIARANESDRALQKKALHSSTRWMPSRSACKTLQPRVWPLRPELEMLSFALEAQRGSIPGASKASSSPKRTPSAPERARSLRGARPVCLRRPVALEPVFSKRRGRHAGTQRAQCEAGDFRQ
jgi:hypothetical protein